MMIPKRSRVHCKTGCEPAPLGRGEVFAACKQETPLSYYVSHPELHTKGLNNIACRKLLLRALNYIRENNI